LRGLRCLKAYILWNGKNGCNLLIVNYDGQVSVYVIFVKYLYILVFRDLIRRSITAPFYVGIVSHVKIYSLTFQVLLDSCIKKSVHLSDCMVICFLFCNNDFKADVIDVAVLSFRATLQTYRENISMTFKRYLYLSLYFES